MNPESAIRERLAVCSWSLKPTGPQDLVEKLQATGVKRVQLALDPLRQAPADWAQTPALLSAAGITVVSGMVTCLGEDYSTLETIRTTGGISPDATWPANLANFEAAAELARDLGLTLVTLHAGFLPHDEADPAYGKLVARLRKVAAVFATRRIKVGLETGQETAEDLAQFLEQLQEPNVGVNFDPANMLLYDKGAPLAALRTLSKWILQVHLKDARRTKTPGTWGEEVALGTGEVEWPAFFRTLRQQGYLGNFAIEREAGEHRIPDIRTAVEVAERSFLAEKTAPGGATEVSATEGKVNVAVVGLGFMGVTHLRAYQAAQNTRIVAVCDAVRLPVNGVLAGVAGNIKKSDDIILGTGVKVYRKLEELLADPDVQAVDLCTPTPLHPEQAKAVLQAGKHVLCEKPLARTSAAAREILAVAQSAKAFLMPAMCMRFWPGWSCLRDIVRTQPYGPVLAARFRRMSEMPAWSKQGTYTTDLGGALFDLHIHDTDFVNFLFGTPKSVYSSGVISGGSINHVVTQYHYPGGPAIYAEGSWLLAKGFNMAYTLHCEKATLDFDLSRGAAALQVTEIGGEPRTLNLEATDGYNQEIAYFIDCVLHNRAPETVTAADGETALRICEAEEKSVRTGQIAIV